ncbi:MAG: hypothetical protein MI919_42600, partial [Holophagales bacterium]|nr:hypothetical protein [Holophagales bacterium]
RAERECGALADSPLPVDAAVARVDADAGSWTVHLPASRELCTRVAPAARIARLRRGLERAAAGDGATAGRLAAAVLASSPSAGERITALYLRGLATASQPSARADLETALAGDLTGSLRPSAWVALGMARAGAEDFAGALDAFEKARAEAPGEGAVVLDLAILFDDHLNRPAEALALYEAYLRSGGPRRQEVAAWAERLREVYP